MRVAVVTGGSSGIGAALGKALTKRGWHCVLVARGQELLETTADEIGAEAEVCDVGDRAQVEDLATRIGSRHPAVDVLVNNAGMAGRIGFLELEPERIEELVRVHYLGSVWCTLAFLPLLEGGAPAHIVNVASIAGTVAYGSSGPYAAAKHAQLAFSRSIGVELAPRRIRVLSVNPGPVETPGFPQERFRSRRLTRGLVLEPEQVAERIVRAIDSGTPEVFARRAYRLAGVAQALAPATFARLARRR